MSERLALVEWMAENPKRRCHIRGPEYGDRVWRLEATDEHGDWISMTHARLEVVIRDFEPRWPTRRAAPSESDASSSAAASAPEDGDG